MISSKTCAFTPVLRYLKAFNNHFTTLRVQLTDLVWGWFRRGCSIPRSPNTLPMGRSKLLNLLTCVHQHFLPLRHLNRLIGSRAWLNTCCSSQTNKDHLEIEKALSELSYMKPSDPLFEDKMDSIIEVQNLINQSSKKKAFFSSDKMMVDVWMCFFKTTNRQHWITLMMRKIDCSWSCTSTSAETSSRRWASRLSKHANTRPPDPTYVSLFPSQAFLVVRQRVVVTHFLVHCSCMNECVGVCILLTSRTYQRLGFWASGPTGWRPTWMPSLTPSPLASLFSRQKEQLMKESKKESERVKEKHSRHTHTYTHLVNKEKRITNNMLLNI